MKTAVKISRIVLCVIVSVCTGYLCGHAGYAAYMKNFRMTVQGEDGYELALGEIALNILPAVVLLLFGVLCLFFLFHRSQGAAIAAAVSAAAVVLFGLRLDTMLSEYMFMRYQLGLTSVPPEIVPSVKPALAILCISAAVCYTVLFLIDHRKTYRKENR